MPTAVDTAASALPRSGGGEAPYAGYAAYRVAPPGPSATTAVSPPASVQPCVELDELERTVNAFQARFDSYKVFKNSCTESYLGEIEQAVDQFLVMHYNPNNGTGEHGSYGAGGGPTDRRGSQTPAMGTAMTNLTKAGAKLLYLLKGGSSGGGSASIPGGSGMTTPAPAPSSRSPSTSTTMTAASAGQPPMVNPFQAKSPSASVLPPGVHSSVTPSSSVNNASGVMVPASAPPPPPQPQSSAASFRYTPDVIPAHYLDEPPSSAVMQSIRLNYPAILHALRHVLPSAHHTHGAPLQASPETASMASPVFEESEHLLFRNELLVPIIRRVWRDHLHPLERKVKELLWVCDNQVIPPFRTHRHAHLMSGGSNDGNGNGDSSAAAVAVSAFATGDGDHGAAFCAVNPTTALAQQQYEETRQTGVEQRVERMRRLLIGDEEYISTIRAMDEEFVSESHSTGSLRGAEDPHRLSDYVPVYGLVLSRLHRLEMEHRTVLEMWGNRRSASSVSQPRWA